VRQHRRHLADGRHLLRVQRMFMGPSQLASLLLDTLFEGMSPGNVFRVLGFQLTAHVVEGARQVANLVFRLDRDLVAEIAGLQAISAAFQRLHRPSHYSPDEKPAENGDQDQAARGIRDHDPATFRQLNVSLRQRQVGVEDAQNLL